MKIMTKKRFEETLLLGVLLLILILPLISADTNYDSYKPYLHKASVGNVPKLETFGEYQTQLFQGSGVYNYNIVVPSGAIGLQPSLSLFYNSQAVLQRPGVLGSGWSLTENSIARNTNYTLNNTNDDYFVLTLGSTRLKLFYNGSNWNAEINPRQFKINNLTNNGKQYWLVTTTDGTNYRFGFNNDSLLTSNTGKSYDLHYGISYSQGRFNYNK
jgi:hypothetical protein